MLFQLLSLLVCSSFAALVFTHENIHSVNLTDASPEDLANYYKFIDENLAEEIIQWRQDFDKLKETDPTKLAVISSITQLKVRSLSSINAVQVKFYSIFFSPFLTFS